VQTAHNPGERRSRLTLNYTTPDRVGIATLRAAAGVERIENFNFVLGAGRTSSLVQIGVELHR
jgi:hypothetical protein